MVVKVIPLLLMVPVWTPTRTIHLQTATITSTQNGTALLGARDIRCQNQYLPSITAVRMLRVGWMVDTQVRHKAAYEDKCVITGMETSVCGATRSKWPTAVITLFTNWAQHQIVFCVTAVWRKQVTVFYSVVLFGKNLKELEMRYSQ